MANPNPPLDPDIAEKGKATRFGAENGPDPSAAGKASAEAQAHKWDIRHELRHVLAQDIDEKFENVDGELKRLMKRGDGKTTLARIAAVRMVEKMIASADPAMSNVVVENACGKLKQELQIGAPRPAKTDNRTPEEAEAAYAEFMKQNRP